MKPSGSEFGSFLADAGQRPYRELIRHHIDRQSKSQLQAAAMGELESLDPEIRARGMDFIDALNSAFARDNHFWKTATCRSAYERIVSVANRTFGRDLEPGKLLDTDPSLAWSLFQISTTSFAYSASDQRAQQRFMGIARGLPVFSTLGLLYGVAAYAYMEAATPAPTVVALGYGVGQLAYAMLVGGLFSGSFQILRLSGRFRVIGAGLALLALSIVLSSAGLAKS